MKTDLGKWKRKILRKSVFIILAALFAAFVIQVVFIDGIFQSSFAEGFVSLCQNYLKIDYYEGVEIYRRIFRDNKILWMALGFILLLLFVFYMAMSQFTRYFKEINAGIDKLAEEKDEHISLSTELDFMEAKLNQVKNSLLKRKQDALESEQRKNDLVVYLAHDIRTPLTSVIGYLSLLEEAYDMPEEQQRKYIKITLDKACRLEKLINEFFEITKYNLQTMILEKEEINLTYMLRQIADEFYPALCSRNKQALVQAEDGIILYGDPDRLARVFQNILKNAAAYSYPDTAIEIPVIADGDQVTIQFKNRGKKIPVHKLDTIFERFYRLDDARSSDTGGSGLGLAIAREIIIQHGGSIAAQSDDEYTTFTITLPLNLR